MGVKIHATNMTGHVYIGHMGTNHTMSLNKSYIITGILFLHSVNCIMIVN